MSTFFMMALGPAGECVTPPAGVSMVSDLTSVMIWEEGWDGEGLKVG